jgi:hypothetical protein
MRLQQADLVARYQHLRQASRLIANELVRDLSKKALDEGGRKLGILQRGIFVFDTEDESSVLMDFCVHDVRERGMNAIERRLAERPPPEDSEEMLILRGLRDACFSLYLIEATEPGVGVQMRDMFAGDTIFVCDINLSQSGTLGVLFAARIVTIDGINMTTGAGLPVAVIPAAEREDFVQGYMSKVQALAARRTTPEEASELAATIIRDCLRRNASAQIRYAEPGEEIEMEPPPMTARHAEWSAPNRNARRARRNELCPCGSGKKFKRCCWGKRA